MKKAFMCSLCHRGILGGGLYLDGATVQYRTQKLTVSRELRHIVLPLAQIEQLTWRWLLFPVATFRMADGREYRFLIFNKSRFLKYYTEARGAL